MGEKDKAAATKKRSIVLFVTDGDNSDHAAAKRILEASEARKDEVYVLFIGIGSGFTFLQKVADKYSNTGLVIVENLKKFVDKSGDEMNDLMIGDELVTWLKK